MKLFQLWLPVALWAGLIFLFSNTPHITTGLDEEFLETGIQWDFIIKKTAHICEYFIFTFLLRRAIKGSWAIEGLKLIIYPAAAALLYAVSDEFHQSFVPGRHANAADLVFDLIGILGVYGVLHVWISIRKSSQ